MKKIIFMLILVSIVILQFVTLIDYISKVNKLQHAIYAMQSVIIKE